MITILLILANAVTLQFIDLSSLLPNPTCDVAEGWEVEEIARIRFEDYADPISGHEGYSNYSCLVDLNPEATPLWQCIIGGKNTIQVLNSDGDHKAFPLGIDQYLIIPEYSNDQVAIYASDRHSIYEQDSETGAYILDANTGTLRTVLEDREGQGQFMPLLGATGILYFTDNQGRIGSSSHFGSTESQVTENTSGSSVMGHSVSGDGQLYVSLLVGGGSQGQVVGVTPEGISWIYALTVPHCVDVSFSGEIVVVTDDSAGILVLDGISGQRIQRFVGDKKAGSRSLNISPNGNYIAALVSEIPAEQYETPQRSLVLIDRSEQSETLIGNLVEHGYSEDLITHHVTDQGHLLMEDVRVPSDDSRRIFLVDQEGNWIWKSENISGTNRIENAGFPISATLTFIENARSGYYIAYYNIALQELVIIKLDKSNGVTR